MDSKSPAPSFGFQPESTLAGNVDQDVAVDAFQNEDHTVSDYVADGILEQQHAVDTRNLSVIGQTLQFKGDLVAEEDLLIQGSVKGTINHRAKNLTIGAHGNVTANIVAQNVIVQGKIQGEIRATESVVIEPSARVVGDIFAPRVGLKEGAKFKGSIDMDADPTAKPSANQSASQSTSQSASQSASAADKKKMPPRSSAKKKSGDDADDSSDSNDASDSE
jgi:cytoskeletal protein CcmA (bactofilin family)